MLSPLTIKRATNKAKSTNTVVTVQNRQLGMIWVFYPSGKIIQTH